jgi:hypothetical protein
MVTTKLNKTDRMTLNLEKIWERIISIYFSFFLRKAVGTAFIDKGRNSNIVQTLNIQAETSSLKLN